MTDVVTYHVLKEDNCPSLSERSILTYHLGCQEINDVGQEGIYIRIFKNSGKGCFSNEWVSFGSLETVLKPSASLSCHSLKDVLHGKSVNTGGFLLAVLKDLGLIEQSATQKRRYEVLDIGPFKADTEALIKSDVRLAIEESPKARKPKPDKAKPKGSPSRPKKDK